MTLRDEIRQTKPFGSPAEEAYLGILRTADLLLRDFEGFFRGHGLTEPRYNALRILRGAGKEGLPCLEVGARMVTRAPDVSRLLDGLEREGLVERRRDGPDRRVVRVRATAKALRLLAAMDPGLRALHRRQFAHMDESELRTLGRILDKTRGGQGPARRTP
jgi:DNA-binding MarR family transcriptional regulator